MTIVKSFFSEDFILSCDLCGREEKHIPTFGDAVALKRKNDWTSIKIDDGWEDICPECREEGEE